MEEGAAPWKPVQTQAGQWVEVMLLPTGHSFLLIALILCEDQLFLSRGYLLRLCACGQHLTAEPEQTLCFLIFLSLWGKEKKTLVLVPHPQRGNIRRPWPRAVRPPLTWASSDWCQCPRTSPSAQAAPLPGKGPRARLLTPTSRAGRRRLDVVPGTTLTMRLAANRSFVL